LYAGGCITIASLDFQAPQRRRPVLSVVWVLIFHQAALDALHFTRDHFFHRGGNVSLDGLGVFGTDDSFNGFFELFVCQLSRPPQCLADFLDVDPVILLGEGRWAVGKFSSDSVRQLFFYFGLVLADMRQDAV